MFVVGVLTERYGPVGIAVKLEDGNMTPMPLIVMRVLEMLEAITPDESAQLDRFRTMHMKNWRGMDVGEIGIDVRLNSEI